MNNVFLNDVRPGDPLSAQEENKVRAGVRAANQHLRVDSNVGFVNGLGAPSGTTALDILYVKITSFTVPESAGAYTAMTALNASVLLWNPVSHKWDNDPSGRQVIVRPLWDGQGFLPLEINQKAVPVRFHSGIGAYVPLAISEGAVVVPTSDTLDADGMQPAKRLVYDSDAKDWVIVDDCYLLRIGN